MTTPEPTPKPDDAVTSDLAAWVMASRLAQRLPPRVTDPAVLSRVAALVADPLPRSP